MLSRGVRLLRAARHWEGSRTASSFAFPGHVPMSSRPEDVDAALHGWAPSGPFLAPRHATTIISVRKNGMVAVVGDGQVTLGSQVVKPNARKVRRIGDGKVLVGFAGATADALTLLDRLESKLEAHSNQLLRSCVELAKEWRTEKFLRPLQAVMLVSDSTLTLEVTGNGEVLEPHDGIVAIGSGGGFARAAAKALMDTDLTAMQVAERAMAVASEMCIYTNGNFVKDEMECAGPDSRE
jgi:ATP-dependent HslUV protease, peptidase subunit HslV